MEFIQTEYDTNLNVGDKMYLFYNQTNCNVIPDGVYWLYPSNSNVYGDMLSYFTNPLTTPITIVTISGGDGIVTSLDSCTYDGDIIYMYKLYYDYSDSSNVIGFTNTTDACQNTNFMMVYSTSSNFTVGTEIYTDIRMTTPISAIDYNGSEKYYKFEAEYANVLYTNYVTFDTDNKTVYSVDLC
jgi:hypothetical protein